LVLNQGLRYMESSFKKQQQGPLIDSVGMILVVGLLISAAIMAAGNVPWIVWGGFIVIAFGVAIVERIRS
jgi:amino acid transporter